MSKIEQFIEKCGQIFKNHQVWSEDKLEYVLLQSDYNSITQDLKSLDKWISVEKPPKEGCGYFLACTKHNDISKVWYNKDSIHKWWYDRNYREPALEIEDVTHWQPLPQPPKEK